MTQLRLVADSMRQIEQGTDCQTVLQTLSSTARSDEATSIVGTAAVRAIFHIGGDDATIRQYLLEAISDQRTKMSAHRAALDLLVYVANPEIRATVLDLFKNDWPSNRWGGYLSFFVELGDTAFLRWAEEALPGYTAGSSHRRVLEDAIARIRAQESLDHILAYLESTDKYWNAQWALRQACRHGATRERIRAAVRSSLSDPADDRANLPRAAALVSVCDELGILQPEDAEDSLLIQRTREVVRRHVTEEVHHPGWAKATIDAKRAAFYGFDRVRSE